MHPVLFHVGSWPVYTYGFMCALGMSAGYFVVASRAREAGIDEDDYLNLFIIMMLTSIGGARLTFALTYPQYFRDDWTNIFRVWKGGLTIMGGGLLTLLAFVAYCRYYGLKTALVLDLFFGAFPIGIFFGRLGCFGYGCCYGKPSDLPWAVTFPNAYPAVPRHPTQLYAALFMLALFVFLGWYRRRPHTDGMVTCVFLYCYCVYRFLIEFIRADTACENIFGLTYAQAFSLLVLALTAAVHYFHLAALPPDRPKEPGTGK